eukprot:g1047.t1
MAQVQDSSSQDEFHKVRKKHHSHANAAEAKADELKIVPITDDDKVSSSTLVEVVSSTEEPAHFLGEKNPSNTCPCFRSSSRSNRVYNSDTHMSQLNELCDSYDTNNNGKFSRKEVERIVHDLLEAKKEERNVWSMLAALVCALFLFGTASVVSSMIAIQALKEDTVDEMGVLRVKGREDDIIQVQAFEDESEAKDLEYLFNDLLRSSIETINHTEQILFSDNEGVVHSFQITGFVRPNLQTLFLYGANHTRLLIGNTDQELKISGLWAAISYHETSTLHVLHGTPPSDTKLSSFIGARGRKLYQSRYGMMYRQYSSSSFHQTGQRRGDYTRLGTTHRRRQDFSRLNTNYCLRFDINIGHVPWPRISTVHQCYKYKSVWTHGYEQQRTDDLQNRTCTKDLDGDGVRECQCVISNHFL